MIPNLVRVHSVNNYTLVKSMKCKGTIHCEKRVRIRSFFGLYSVQMRENKDRKTPNTDTVQAVIVLDLF